MSNVGMMLQPRQRIIEQDCSPHPGSMSHFLNTPVRTWNQLKLGSIAGSGMVSPYPSKRQNFAIDGDFKDAVNGATNL